MKFKMAPNSLFAVLLRSRWWVSLSVGVVFVAAAHALAPAEYRLLASTGALPFFGITLVAAWRQLRAPSPARVEQGLQAAGAMAWESFTDALVRGFERQGHTVQRLPAGGAADLRIERAGRTTLVAARRWKAARHGAEPLQALLQAARAQEGAACVYVALGELSPQALKLVASGPVDVLTGERLIVLLQK